MSREYHIVKNYFYKNFTDSIAAPCYRSNRVIDKLSVHLCYSFDSVERGVDWSIACGGIAICFFAVSSSSITAVDLTPVPVITCRLERE